MSFLGTGDSPSVFFAFIFKEFSKKMEGLKVLDMYMIGGILVLTVLMAALITWSDSVVEEGKDQ
ncbi:hypothetical protein [Gottfriedia acidiceleris]|uniref:hypothetical protein n=1 Tax=Gottfriedia acidiceleris TaxID=371036 RepID=UPI0039A3EA4F